jgi:radical SAM superfamily enzyme YgiQ (UPF0313 family)
MKNLKIFLGDLTYDTLTLSTEGTPLNIGYIGAYTKKIFGNKIDIKLFKYHEKIEQAILDSPPDVLGLSNYAWNHRISAEIFRIALKANPNIITVWGGPNFPADMISQEKFMGRYPEVDFYVPLEGEIGFSNIINEILNSKSIDDFKQLQHNPIENCVVRLPNNKIQYTIGSPRIKELDEIPSPYLNGMLDEFFDGKLSPMFQTNRGCPFQCTFCVDGSKEVTRVNKFSISRVRDELQYIAKHIPKGTSSMIISDLNFGMIPGDLQICDEIAIVQKEYNWPKSIQATTGKNSKEQIIEATSKLNGALRLTMSVQSMDQDILTNIKRQNISLDQMLELAPTLKKNGLPTSSEIILGLPGDTYEKHIQSVKDIIQAKIDYIEIHSCMLLDGAEMNTPQEREKWGFKTKFRIIPRDFVKLKNGKVIMEIEEIIVGLKTLTFEEYVKLRMLAFSVFVTNFDIGFKSIINLLRENKIDVFNLFNEIIQNLDKSPKNVQDVFMKFKNETINELWDSPEEIESFYQNEKEYQKLLSGEVGNNNLQMHHALLMANYMKEFSSYVIETAENLLKKQNMFNNEVQTQFKEITNFCYGLSHNLLGDDRMTKNPEFIFSYDIQKWLNNLDELPLSNFKFNSPQKIRFVFTDEQYQVSEEKKSIFGNSPAGLAQVIKRMPARMHWRNPTLQIKITTT